jgi:hypothetical protein
VNTGTDPKTGAEESAAHPLIPARFLPLSYPANDVPGYKPGIISAMVSAKDQPHLAIINPTFDDDLRARFGHLFAAAPELLAAVKMALESLNAINVEQEWDCREELEDAIAKAEGRHV